MLSCSFALFLWSEWKIRLPQLQRVPIHQPYSQLLTCPLLMTYRSQPCCKVHVLPYSTARVPDVLARQIASVSASQYMALHPNMSRYSPRAVPQRNLCAMQGCACRDDTLCSTARKLLHQIKCNNKLEADRVGVTC